MEVRYAIHCTTMEVLARGDSITVVPVSRVTTQQAADLVNVSRQQVLVRLLD